MLSGPTLSAGAVAVGDTLTCTASATDADLDTVSITYAWSDGSTGATYAVTDTDDPGNTITCTATADDGDGGVVAGTASATVTNTDPTVDSITVSPSTGQVGVLLLGRPGRRWRQPLRRLRGRPAIPVPPTSSSDDQGDVLACTATATTPTAAPRAASAPRSKTPTPRSTASR